MTAKRTSGLATLLVAVTLLAPAPAAAGPLLGGAGAGCYSPCHYWTPALWRIHARITYGPIAPQYAGEAGDFFPVGYRVIQWPCPYVAPGPLWTKPDIVPAVAPASGAGADQSSEKAKQ